MAKKHIETLNIDISRKTTKHLLETVGEEVVPIRRNNTGRVYVRKRLDIAGKTTKLTLTQYFEQLFVRNEFLACQGAPLTNPQIEHNIFQEFPNQRLRAIKNHHTPIGPFRNRYMKRVLYANQAIPIIASFRYDEQGYIVRSDNANRYLSFQECRAICEDKQIADPRFFTHDEIQQIAIAANTQKTDWFYPDEEEYNTIKKKIDKHPYNCLRFPEGLGLI